MRKCTLCGSLARARAPTLRPTRCRSDSSTHAFAATSATRLLLLEHEPVVTLGRSGRTRPTFSRPRGACRQRRRCARDGTGRRRDLPRARAARGVPIFDLRPDRCDVRRYVRDLARVMIALAAATESMRAFSRETRSSWGYGWTRQARALARRPAPGPEARCDRQDRRDRRAPFPLGHDARMCIQRIDRSFGVQAHRAVRDRARYGVTSLAALGESAPRSSDGSPNRVPCFERVFDADAVGRVRRDERDLRLPGAPRAAPRGLP
jgi:hypothetical protein